MNFSEDDVGKRVTNKKTGEVTYIRYFAEKPSLGLANSISFANESPISDEWDLLDEKKETLSDKIDLFQVNHVSEDGKLVKPGFLESDVREHLKEFLLDVRTLFIVSEDREDYDKIASKIFGKELIK